MKKIITLCLSLLWLVASQAAGAKKPLAGHVVFIGLDGWGSFSMQRAEMPFVRSLMEQGCWTVEKRTVLPSSSAVNRASMFMGAGPELHGYTEWGSKTPQVWIGRPMAGVFR